MKITLTLYISLFLTIIGSSQKVENRIDLVQKLKERIDNNIPIVAHVLVPLCDNENQGIVPTSAKIGNGMDLRNNLYWATSKGMKRFFKELPDWKLMRSTLNVDTNILERVVFFKKFSNGANVYLIADAYRGDRMEECLNDYFNSLSSFKNDTLIIGTDSLKINGGADLVAFNGHNGLMDENTQYKSANWFTKPKDAVSISCISNSYFKEHYENTSSYPLVHTTNLLYPGAFIMEGVINNWAMLKTDKECKIAAGKGYYKYKPKSGPNGSQNLFDFGWGIED
ncbi:MAG: hypothetical protein ACI9N1_002141 [Flavobacteriales bacterium]|jgi:hypothetical protein